MEKESYKNLDSNNHCTHVPAVEINDLNIFEDNKYGNYIELDVTIPIFTDYFQSIDVIMEEEELNTIKSKAEIIKSNKNSDNDKFLLSYPADISDPNTGHYTCWLVLDNTYAVERLDARVCEHIQPLQQYLMEIRSNKSNSGYFGEYKSANYSSFNSSNINGRQLLIFGYIRAAATWTYETTSEIVEETADFVETVSGEALEVVSDVSNAVRDVSIQFGDAIYQTIIDILEAINNLLSGTINISNKYGIWVDNFGLVISGSSSSSGKRQSSDKVITIKYSASGRYSIDTTTTVKFGGRIGLIASYSLIPPDVSSLEVYMEAGMGFEFTVDLEINAQLQVEIKCRKSKHNTYWIGYIPVLITIYGQISIGTTIQATGFKVAFHTGIGEYSRRYGTRYTDGGNIQSYEETRNTLTTPTFDMVYGFDNNNGGSCFNIQITPTIEFEAGIAFYRAYTLALAIPFSGGIQLNYPSITCSGNNYCVSGQDQHLGIETNNFEISAYIKFYFTSEFSYFMDLIGVSTSSANYQSPNFFTLDIGIGGSSTCVKYNFDFLLDICCNQGSWTTDSTQSLQETAVTDINTDAEDLDALNVGAGDYPKANQVYYIRSYHLQNLYLTYDFINGMQWLLPSGVINVYDKTRQWYFEYKDDELHTYNIHNIWFGYLHDENSYLSTTSTGEVELTNQDDGSGRQQWVLELKDYDINTNKARYYIKIKGGTGPLEYLVAPESETSSLDATLLIEPPSNGNGEFVADDRHLFFIEKPFEYDNLPSTYTEYWIKTNDNKLVSSTSNANDLETANYGDETLFSRFLFIKMNYEYYSINVANYKQLPNRRYLLCAEGNGLTISNSADAIYIEGHCKWHIIPLATQNKFRLELHPGLLSLRYDGTSFTLADYSQYTSVSEEFEFEFELPGWRYCDNLNLTFHSNYASMNNNKNKYAECININEGSDPHTWNDNYLCSNIPINIYFQSYWSSSLDSMNCIIINEPSDPHTWWDNYLCLPNNSPYTLYWSNSGKISGKNCVLFNEPSDPYTWWDNYLCWETNVIQHLDMTWSSSGEDNTKYCVQWHEGSSPVSHTWMDNYLCMKPQCSYLSFKWSSSGSTHNMDCTNVYELSEPSAHTWQDNYFCKPKNIPYQFLWSSSGEIPNKDCLQITEGSDPYTWHDNYLCTEKA